MKPLVMTTLAALLTGSLAAAGCDGTSGMAMGDPDAGVSAEPVGTFPETMNPYRFVRGRGAGAGAPIDPARLFAELGAADAVCLGETHDDADHHAGQRVVLDGLLAQAGKRLAVGMEMFEKPFQPVLDDYAAGRIDERTMLLRTQWQQRWGFDYDLYRPLVERTVRAGANLLALKTASELTRKISAAKGLETLTAEERAELPELDLANAEHRAFFERTAPHAGSDAFYLIQVIWDETMADTAWRWLAAQGGAPRQVVVIAGWGHCMDLAIPSRIRRRGAARAVSVRAVVNGPQVAERVAEGYTDYLIVYGP